jgi:hypothetical protein
MAISLEEKLKDAIKNAKPRKLAEVVKYLQTYLDLIDFAKKVDAVGDHDERWTKLHELLRRI